METPVDAVPTLLGRLVLLATILDRETGTYQPRLIGIPSDSSAELEALHRALLMTWLSASMETQVSDAVEYFKSSPAHEGLDPFLLRGGYARLLPPNVDSAHQEHFLQTIPNIIALATRS
jgi:hypothetical protein